MKADLLRFSLGSIIASIPVILSQFQFEFLWSFIEIFLILHYLLFIGGYIFCLIKTYKDPSAQKGAGAALLGLLIFLIPQILASFIPLFTISDEIDISFMELWMPMAGTSILILFLLLSFTLYIFSSWKLFVKAGREGWESLLPVYNSYVLCLIGGAPGWWVAMLFIPGVNIVFSIMMINKVVHRFGKDSSFTVGVIFLPMIFWPVLALGRNSYRKLNEKPAFK